MMLLEIYYSGALTMFFSTDMTIPFENVKQVIQAYPDWKLRVVPGTESVFLYYASTGDPDFVSFWERLEKSPRETYFDMNIPAMKDNYEVVLAPDVGVRAYMNKRPEFREGIYAFGRTKMEFAYMVVPDNSPLVPALRHSAVLAFERGKFEKYKHQYATGH